MADTTSASEDSNVLDLNDVLKFVSKQFQSAYQVLNQNVEINLFSTSPYKGVMDFGLNAVAALTFAIVYGAVGFFIHLGFSAYHLYSAFNSQDDKEKNQCLHNAGVDFLIAAINWISGIIIALTILAVKLNFVYKTVCFIYQSLGNLGLTDKFPAFLSQFSDVIKQVNDYFQQLMPYVLPLYQAVEQLYTWFNKFMENNLAQKEKIIFGENSLFKGNNLDTSTNSLSYNPK